jgi:hypothetical protein
LCIILAFYAYVVHAVFTPHVSSEYANYYIFKTTNLSIAERKKLIPIIPDQQYTHKDSDTLGFDGWLSPEDQHRWTAKNIAHIVFRISDLSALGHTPAIQLSAFSPNPQDVTFLMNGTPVKTITINGETEILLQPPITMFISGMNELSFNNLCPNTQTCFSNGDNKIPSLGIRTFSILSQH